MSKRIIITTYIVFSILNCLAQKQNNNWCIGNHAGVNFNTTPPTMFTTPFTCLESGATISDRHSGQLLFYTNGVDVFGKNFNRMPNGDTIGTDYIYSSAQGALISPDPGDSNKYYIFTLENSYTNDTFQRLRYSVVDIRLNNGLGDIVPGQKNIVIDSVMSEAMVLAKGLNSELWLLVFSKYTTEIFAYKISCSGLNLSPVKSATGFSYPYWFLNRGVSFLKVSPDNSRISHLVLNNAIPSIQTIILLYDFNQVTGVVSNAKIIDSTGYTQSYNHFWGLEFSPNSSLLYVSDHSYQVQKIYQYDLSLANASAIFNSRKTVFQTLPYTPTSIQMGPDSNLYVSIFNSYLDKISDADSLYPKCNYTKQAVPFSFASGRFPMSSLPRPVIYPDTLATRVSANFDAPDSSCNLVTFVNRSANAMSYLWKFGDGTTDSVKNPQHTYMSNGVFTVTLYAYNTNSCNSMDSFSVNLLIQDNIVAKANITDTACIGRPVQFINKTNNAIKYFWKFGDGSIDSSANPTHSYSSTGTYIIQYVVENINMCNIRDTIIDTIEIVNSNVIANFAAPSTICINYVMQFENKTSNASAYTWYFGDGNSDTTFNPKYVYSHSGNYPIKLIAQNPKMCQSADSVIKNIVVKASPNLNVNDTVICDTGLVYLSVNLTPDTGLYFYKWQPIPAIIGNPNQKKILGNTFNSLQFIINVKDSILGVCSNTQIDTLNVTISQEPIKPIAYNNGPVCEDDTLFLFSKSLTSDVIYKWSGPVGFSSLHQNPKITYVKEYIAGRYIVSVRKGGCVEYDTTDVFIKDKPKVIAKSKVVGGDLYLYSEADSDSLNFSWEGPSGFKSKIQNPYIPHVGYNHQGYYKVTVNKDGCRSSAITTVSISDIDSVYFRLYPNPSPGIFIIEGRTKFEQTIPLIIFNDIGQRVYNIKIQTHNRNFKNDIVLPDLANGIYMLRAFIDAKYISIPLTIMH